MQAQRRGEVGMAPGVAGVAVARHPRNPGDAAVDTSQPVTHWIEQAKQGNRDAAERLLHRYFHDLVCQARGRLRPAARQAADEEDIALSAFDSVYHGLEEQRFPNLTGRGNLWGLLLFKVRTKALNWDKHEALRHPPLSKDDMLRLFSDEEAGREPSSAEAAAFAELLERCLATLPNEPDLPLRRVAALLLEDRSPAEIAATLGCLEADVKRYEPMIHARWRQIIDPQISPSVDH